MKDITKTSLLESLMTGYSLEKKGKATILHITEYMEIRLSCNGETRGVPWPFERDTPSEEDGKGENIIEKRGRENRG